MADLEMYRGDTAPFIGAAVNGDGNPRDITTDTLFFTAKTDISDTDLEAVIALETGSGIEATDAVEGLFLVTIPPSATTSLVITEPVVLQYDIQLVDEDDNVYTMDRGTLTVIPDVTRSVS